MFGFIIFILVVSFIGRLFTRPFFGYYRPWMHPYGGFGGWGMGPMYHRGCRHHHHHHHW